MKKYLRRCYENPPGHNFDFIAKSTWEDFLNIYKTLPEAQRTQGLESTTWVNLSASNSFQIRPPDSATCISCKFGHQTARLVLVPNLVTRWRQSYKFDYQMAPLALVPNLVTRWRHLHKLQICSPYGDISFQCAFSDLLQIGSKCGHWVTSLALVSKLTIRLSHFHCHIALDCPIDFIS